MSSSNSRDRGRRAEGPPELVASPGRVPPHDLDAEAAVLSAVLLSGEAFDVANEVVKPEHFYSDANRRVYGACVELAVARRPVDAVTVAIELKNQGYLEQIGGTAYISRLTYETPSVANVEAYARVVREKWRLRQVISSCQQFAAEGYGNCGEVQAFVDRAEQAIFAIALSPEANAIVPLKDALKGAFQILQDAQSRGDGISGVPTGFTQLDRLMSGLHPGDLYIVAARPAMGKTSFVLNMAVNVARPRPGGAIDPNDPYADPAPETPGYGVAFFSLEMPREQLAARLLASEARVSMSDIRKGTVQRDDWRKLTDAAARLGNMPVWLDDTPALGLLELRAKVRRLQAEIGRSNDPLKPEKLGLVAVDYLQLMQGRRDAGSREQEISELSRGLKQLAKELQVPVLALSQLNRSVETRNAKDKRPQLSDLRESGAIEQDADAIMFIYRDDYYFPDTTQEKGIAEIIIAKQRNGPTDTIKTRFTGAYTRFDNVEQDNFYDGQLDDFDASIAGLGP